MPRIAILGSLALDHLDWGTRVGGGAYHGARGLKLLGGDGLVVTQTARPELLAPLEELGLPVHRRDARGPTFSLHYDGDVRTMLVEEVGDPWRPGEWLDAVEGIGWVHVAPLHRSDFPAETLAALSRGRRVMLDGQGLVRVPETGPLKLDADFDPEVLRHVSMLKLAEEEARALLPRIDEESVAALGVEEVLLTYGGFGSTLYLEGACTEVPADRVDADSTGAGDAFCAAYVSARAAGEAPLAAARLATELVHRLLAGE